jgi:hypothetical protein
MRIHEWVLTVLAAIAIFLFVSVNVVSCDMKQKCDKACDPQVALRIDGECHCKNTGGWVRAHEAEEGK